MKVSVVDRHRFYADPDPNFHVDVDPDPDPDCHVHIEILWKKVYLYGSLPTFSYAWYRY